MVKDLGGDDAQTKFASLPLDILITLMNHLDPLDLIALRKTCRALYNASQQRIVWIKALESICASNNVFLPTFRLDQMSTASLSRVATAPAKWLASLRRRGRQQDSAEILRGPPAPNQSPISLGLSPNDEVQKVFLVPGGRFVVLLTLHELHLWDLEQAQVHGADNNGSERPLACVVMNQQYNITFSVQPTKDSMGMRVAVASYPMSTAANRRKQIVVYEIWPLGSRPEFTEIATLGVNSVAPSSSHHLAGDRLVFLDGKIVKVWDFVGGQRAEWDTQKHFLNNIFVTSDVILLLNHEETVVWRIPELKPLDQDPAPSSRDNIFSFPSLLVLNEEGMKLAHWGALDDWYWDKQEHFFDVFMGDKKKKTLTLARYNLSCASTITPIAPPLTFRLSPGTGNYSLQYRCCEGELLACSSSAGGEFAHLVILGKEPQDCAHVLMKVNHEMSSVLDYSICPVSGKMCYATDENEIEVVDLFRMTAS